METGKAMHPPFSEGRYEPDGTHHGGPPTSGTPTLTSPSVRSEQTEGSGPAVAQQDWEAGARGGGGGSWVWRGV